MPDVSTVSSGFQDSVSRMLEKNSEFYSTRLGPIPVKNSPKNHGRLSNRKRPTRPVSGCGWSHQSWLPWPLLLGTKRTRSGTKHLTRDHDSTRKVLPEWCRCRESIVKIVTLSTSLLKVCKFQVEEDYMKDHETRHCHDHPWPTMVSDSDRPV